MQDKLNEVPPTKVSNSIEMKMEFVLELIENTEFDAIDDW